MTDEQQIKVAAATGAVIFTHDVDFLRIAQRRRHIGIIYVHQQKLTVGECVKRLKAIAETKSLAEMRDQVVFL